MAIPLEECNNDADLFTLEEWSSEENDPDVRIRFLPQPGTHSRSRNTTYCGSKETLRIWLNDDNNKAYVWVKVDPDINIGDDGQAGMPDHGNPVWRLPIAGGIVYVMNKDFLDKPYRDFYGILAYRELTRVGVERGVVSGVHGQTPGYRIYYIVPIEEFTGEVLAAITIREALDRGFTEGVGLVREIRDNLTQYNEGQVQIQRLQGRIPQETMEEVVARARNILNHFIEVTQEVNTQPTTISLVERSHYRRLNQMFDGNDDDDTSSVSASDTSFDDTSVITFNQAKQSMEFRSKYKHVSSLSPMGNQRLFDLNNNDDFIIVYPREIRIYLSGSQNAVQISNELSFSSFLLHPDYPIVRFTNGNKLYSFDILVGIQTTLYDFV